MADFDLIQTDAQVQSILNDAQDAQGAGAQTTLTTDYIMLKGTNGRYHKILKDSFTEAVRNVLAGLLVNNDKGTTISQIPAIASGDFGSVTPENLASVLGVYSTKNKVYSQNTTVGQTITIPGTSYGIYAAFDYSIGYTAIFLVGFRTIKVVDELFTAPRKYTFATNDNSQLVFTLNGDINGVLDVYNLVKR